MFAREPSPDGWTITPSGLIAPDTAVRGYYDPQSKPRRPVAISFFTGAGGFDLGMVQAGFDVIAACEIAPIAVLTYLTNLGADRVEMHFVSDADDLAMDKALAAEGRRQREQMQRAMESCAAQGHTHGPGIHRGDRFIPDFPEDSIPPWLRSGSNRRQITDGPGCRHMWVGDVRKITGAEILAALGLRRGEVDLVFGGPPCQGYSFAGKRDVMDPRNSLVFDFARLICEIAPKTMAMENVEGILSMTTPEGVPVLDALARVLEDGGMGTYNALKRSLAANVGMGVAMLKPEEKPSKSSAQSKRNTSSEGGLAEWINQTG